LRRGAFFFFTVAKVLFGTHPRELESQRESFAAELRDVKPVSCFFLNERGGLWLLGIQAGCYTESIHGTRSEIWPDTAEWISLILIRS
jgi:hypothetical protein